MECQNVFVLQKATDKVISPIIIPPKPWNLAQTCILLLVELLYLQGYWWISAPENPACSNYWNAYDSCMRPDKEETFLKLTDQFLTYKTFISRKIKDTYTDRLIYWYMNKLTKTKTHLNTRLFSNCVVILVTVPWLTSGKNGMWESDSRLNILTLLNYLKLQPNAVY